MKIINPGKRGIHLLPFLILLLLFFCTSCMSTSMPFQENRDSWKFAVVSDTQGNNKNINKTCINDAVLQTIADDIVREKPDLVIVAGDLVNGWFRNGGTNYGTQYKNWKIAMKSVYQAGIPVYPIRGNHDSGPERLILKPLPVHLEPPVDTPLILKESFRSSFAETYIPENGPVNESRLTYSFVHKNSFFIAMDQFTEGQHKVNHGWLERLLAENKNTHFFIFGHEPAFGADHMDNLGFYKKDRDIFWNAIGRAGGRTYFCGHDHFYNRSLILDDEGHQIYQIIIGTGGGILRKWSGHYQDGKRVKGEFHSNDYHGYLLVTVEGNKATIIWKALMTPGIMKSWKYLDTFTYSVPVQKKMRIVNVQ
ncbi:MAG: metallophosphoesterase [Smithella sp.]